ncbi:hypothetical protein F3087_09520 [Nocardia colli]|uniref:LppX_LprAFG lipoprotein n=1 Tax=Nocardia colli TaxID=2545717 RepID=A0A5N0EK30_9NOCA|nr:hypothetical protein [Nocardia colli]KAA8889190.1 hypothetical protein F3087_09520 [Nocardia colli]
MPHRRSRLVALFGALLLTTTGCIGAVDRADFDKVVQARGGGLVSALPAAAIDTLRQRLGVSDFRVGVIMLTAPETRTTRWGMLEQPPQVTRFSNENPGLFTQDSAVHLRIQVPTRPEQQDDYTYANHTLHDPRPVHVSAAEHPDTEMFDVSEVSGLLRLEEILDTALARTAVTDGHVSAVIVSRLGDAIRISVTVTSPRTTMVADFDRAGTFLRMDRV